MARWRFIATAAWSIVALVILSALVFAKRGVMCVVGGSQNMFNKKLKAELKQALTDLYESKYDYSISSAREQRLSTDYYARVAELDDAKAELGSANNRLALLRSQCEDLHITIESQKEQREAVERKLSDALSVTAVLRADNEELRRRNAALVDIALRANERLNHFWLGVAMSAQRN